jgi:hypothetical protein
MREAAAGEILLSDMVRGLVVGSGLALVARSPLPVAAQDLSGAWPLFALAEG